MINKINNYSFLLYWLLLDTAFVLLHLMTSHRTGLFHLDYEQNIPTIYQSAKLLAAGSLAILYIWLKKKMVGKIRRAELWFFAPLGAILIFIGLDELGQLHENIYTYVLEIAPRFAIHSNEAVRHLGYSSTDWIIYYLPLIILSVFYFIYAISYTAKNYKDRVWLIIFMVISFLMVLLLEYLGTRQEHPAHVYERYFVFEEYLEMIGATFGFTFIWFAFCDLEKKFDKLLVERKSS